MADTIYRVTLSAPGGATSPTIGYRSIQEAVDIASVDIVNKYLAGTPIDGNYIIEVEDGIYPSFKIRAGITTPLNGTTYRLIIRSADPTEYSPIVDFNRSFSVTVLSGSSVAGADIEEYNPNITIENIRFQFFPIGIRTLQGCHNIKINKCILANNRNAGIFINNSKNVQILQNVVTNGDYGIIARLCKNVAIIHNTVFLNGSVSNNTGTALAAIWAQLDYDFGNGVTDTGKLYLVGNIAWNTAGATLSLLKDDVERIGAIQSNYNDFVVGSDKFITIENRSSSSTSVPAEQIFLGALSNWKARGFDLNSISVDPGFISPIVNSPGRSRHVIDLNLFTDSPVRGIVPSFFDESAATAQWLPVYVDSQDFTSDILSRARLPGGTSAGANNQVSTSSFFGLDVLSSPIQSDNLDCGTAPLAELENKSLDLWYPKYKAGYFYAEDREYYLYARKECRFIGELAVTKFILPFRVDTRAPVGLKVNGKEVEFSRYLDIIGDEIYLFHKDLNISNGNEEIEIRYTIVKLEGGPVPIRGRRRSLLSADSLQELKSKETYNIFKIKDGETRYFLPKTYIPKGPVVLTDDSIYPTNPSFITNKEFAVEWDKKFQQAEIIFHKNNNLCANSNFEYASSLLPIGWVASGVTVQSGSFPNYSLAGSRVCSIGWSGYVSQTFEVTSGNSVFSWYAYSNTPITGDISLSFYDGHQRDLGFVSVSNFVTTGSWQRFYLQIGDTIDSSGEVSIKDYPYVHINTVKPPTNSKSVEVSIHSAITGNIVLDATQYEHSNFPSYYNRTPYGFDITVEFETSEEDYYIDYGKPMASAVTTQNEGFLFIPEIPASAFDGPYSVYVTTLHEWKWADGRRYVMPWARIAGKDKLRKRPKNRFHPYPQDTEYPIVPSKLSNGIEKINIVPEVVIASQLETNGVAFSLSVLDKYNNPFSEAYYTAWISDSRQRFPGWLHKKFYGVKQQLGQTVYGKLDNNGLSSITWIPPSVSNIIVSTKVPSPLSTTTSGQNISIIKTKYPVNPEFNGNVIILNRDNVILNNNLNVITGKYRCNYANNQSIVTTEYPIKSGSIRVFLDSTELFETFVNNPNSDQFYVDYSNGLVFVKGKIANLYIEYIPSYVFIDKTDPYKIIVYHDKVFGGYDDQITICHDSIITLTIDVLDYTVNYYRQAKFDLICTNGLAGKDNAVNKTYLEI
jgi:parallel beta-helix repeat protein